MPPSQRIPDITARSRELRQSQTDAEKKLWAHLRAHRLNGVHFKRQHVMSNHIVDFCAPRQKIVIEVDGGQHLDQQKYDAERTRYLESRGYRVLRFWNDEVLKNIESVLDSILISLENRKNEKTPSQPPPF